MGITLLPIKNRGGKMENNQEPVTQTEEKTEDVAVTQTEEKTEAKEEKSFTQADMNKLEMKIEKKFKEKYKGYDKWLETQKTEAEKQQEKDRKYIDTERENKVLKSDVNVEDVDYVVYKVSKMEGNFEDNLEEFLKENPKYLRIKTVDTPQNTGVAVSKIKSDEEDGVMSILKAKHPEAF